MSGALVLHDAMRNAIAAAHSVDEVLAIRDHARRAAAYARVAKDHESVRKCQEIQRRAERKCGEELRELPKAKPRGSNQHEEVSRGPTHPQPLSDLGISRDQSSEWQKLAEVPEDEFEFALTAPGPMPSAKTIVEQHKISKLPSSPKVDRVDPMALWLWGHLSEFERNGVLAMDPNFLVRTMLDHMEEKTLELAPRVAAWLQRIGQ